MTLLSMVMAFVTGGSLIALLIILVGYAETLKGSKKWRSRAEYLNHDNKPWDSIDPLTGGYEINE